MDDKTAMDASFVLRIVGSDLNNVSTICGLEPYKREEGGDGRVVKLHYDLPSGGSQGWGVLQSELESFFVLHRDEFRGLTRRPEVAKVVVDVGLNYAAEKMSLNIPLRYDLLEAVGTCGIHLNIAIYRTD